MLAEKAAKSSEATQEPEVDKSQTAGKSSGIDPLNTRLDQLLTAAAKLHGSQTYLTDAPNKIEVCGAEPRSFSFSEADAYVMKVAALLAMVGVKQDDTVLLRLPNTVEASLFAFGCWRAGARVCALPLSFRAAEWREPLKHIAPKALITCGQIGQENANETAYALAEDLFSIRFVGALYGSDQDGIMDIDQMLSEMPDDGPELIVGEKQSDTVASLHLSETPHGMAILPHTHGSLAANAAVLNGSLKLQSGGSVLQTFMPSGLIGMIGGPVISLLSGATCHLHHPFDDQSFENQLGTVTAALIPGAIADGLPDTIADRCVSIWPYGHMSSAPSTKVKRNLASFGDIGLVPVKRTEDGGFSVSLGSVGPDSDGRYGSINITEGAASVGLGSASSRVMQQDNTAQLEISGSIVPDHASMASLNIGGNSFFTGTKKGAILLPVSVRPSSVNSGEAELTGLVDGFHLIGGMSTSLTDMESLLALQPGISAAAFTERNQKLDVVVVPEGAQEIEAEEISELIDKRNLGTHKHPETVVSVTSLPKTSRGKIDREKLRAQIKAALADF